MVTKLEADLELAKQQLGKLARGLFPVAVDFESLSIGLSELAKNITTEYGIECRAECVENLAVDDDFIVTQLYLIAREAVYNAIRHAKPSLIVIRLQNSRGLHLSVEDDGCGIHENAHNSEGMGLRIMRHRCSLIGSRLTLTTADSGGTIVTCSVGGQ